MSSEVWSLWRFRAAIQVLIARELKVRYRGAALGFLWSFANPLIFMSVYVLVFSVYLRIDVERYPAFVLCGLLPWTWFAASLTEASRSIIDNRALVKKVALPSAIFPLVAIGSNLAHFLLSLPVLFVLLLGLGVRLSWSVALLPLVLLAQFLLTFGIALTCSSLAVRFRDLLQIVPNLLALWFFVTPIFYPERMVPEGFRALVFMNPMAPLIKLYQEILYEGRAPDAAPLGLLLLLGLALVLVGDRVFVARREFFAEEI
jgi:homopolymeric O-antigen transport system permease protein